MKLATHRTLLALGAILLAAGAAPAAEGLKSYQSGTKDFWTNPPPDWFLGDETEAQKGLAPAGRTADRCLRAELDDHLKNIKLPPGFKIEVYACGVLAARQMAWGDNGTLFVGSFGLGNVYAITGRGRKEEVKTVLKGLNMPTGIAFLDGALYVIDVDKLIRYESAEANLDKIRCRQGRLRRHAALCRAWLEISRRRQGRLVLRAVRPALQRRPAADERVADPPRRS